MNEFQAGAFSGLAQNIVGHPFDTAKGFYSEQQMFKIIKTTTIL